jgi:hypothetical protein
MTHQFVVMWDCNGLEYVGNITEDQGLKTWAALKGEEYRGMPNLLHLRLRAQANHQRNYEIYFVDAAEGITTEDICSMFEADPQSAAETVRQLGQVFYSNRIDMSDRVIV